jgi:hypothetical protein
MCGCGKVSMKKQAPQERERGHRHEHDRPGDEHHTGEDREPVDEGQLSLF